tara:strand:+ start:158 stop:340 length:183 start_codon:yes stop_codon:yes gene_type:complete
MTEQQFYKLLDALENIDTAINAEAKCDISGLTIADSLGRLTVTMDQIANTLHKIQLDIKD